MKLCGETKTQKRNDIRNIYLPSDFVPVWTDFMEICEREGESGSEKIRKFVSRYVLVHKKGNPQTQLAKYGSIIQKECYFCEGRFDMLRKVKFISGLIAATCEECLEENQRKTTVEKVLGIV